MDFNLLCNALCKCSRQDNSLRMHTKKSTSAYPDLAGHSKLTSNKANSSDSSSFSSVRSLLQVKAATLGSKMFARLQLILPLSISFDATGNITSWLLYTTFKIEQASIEPKRKCHRSSREADPSSNPVEISPDRSPRGRKYMLLGSSDRRNTAPKTVEALSTRILRSHVQFHL